MNKTKIGGILLVAGLMLTGCGTGQSSEANKVLSLTPSYAELFTTVPGLTKAADAVVVGTVTASVDAPPVDGLPFTNALVEVEEWVKGGAEDNQVTIHQTGGTLDGVAFLDEDNPLLEVGERGIFYLQKVPAGYVTLSGPTGRMTIAEGKALPLPASTLTDIGTFKDVSAVIAETERLSTE